MAARRLILLLVLLLVISSIAAQLAQPPVSDPTTTDSSTTSTTAEPDAPAGRLLRRRIAAPATETALIRAAPGDQLELVVSVRGSGTVEIPGRGLTASASPGAPARFDLLLREPGRLEVLGPGERAVAAISVERRSGRNPAE